MNADEKSRLGGRVAAVLPDGWSYSIVYPPKGRTAIVEIKASPYDEEPLFTVKSSDADGILWRIIIEQHRLTDDDFPSSGWIDKRIGACCAVR